MFKLQRTSLSLDPPKEKSSITSRNIWRGEGGSAGGCSVVKIVVEI